MKIVRICAVIVLVFVIAGKVAMWRSYQSRSAARQAAAAAAAPVTANDSIEARMHGVAEVALATVEPQARKNFDFSPASLTQVDTMLARLPEMVSATNRDEELSYSCLAWGAYVGEVVRKQYPGSQWAETVDDTGHGSYPMQVSGQTICPCQWAVNRLQDGPSASVALRYQLFVKEQGAHKEVPGATTNVSR